MPATEPTGTIVADQTPAPPVGTQAQAPEGAMIAQVVTRSPIQQTAFQRGSPPPQAKTANNGGYRAYRDGVVTTMHRETVVLEALDDVETVDLPYASTEVIDRIGEYDVVAELGRGGMGVVYKAYSLRLCRWCAIKLMIAGKHASHVQLVRFQNEAMLAARLSHPGIVPIYDAGESDGRFYFVMGFVEGRPLDAFIADPEVDTSTIVELVAKCARALAYAHERGIVHRDLKPENVLVDAEGEPHITDFGIAANVQTEKRLTHDGAVMGTPAYMSPEQINGEIANIGPRSDVYSLGASLFHLLTGREPHPGRTVNEILNAVLEREVQRPSRVAKGHSGREIDPDLDTIVIKAMEKRAGDRYAGMAELAADLEAWLADKPVSARPISGGERLRKLIRRNRAAFAVSALVFTTLVVLTMAFGAVTVVNIQRTSETIRDQSRQAALEQANTLERAIRVNMLQGRADVVRELMTRLRSDPLSRGVEVVRTDGSLAYTDISTRKQVERRLQDAQVMAWIEQTHPDMLDKVAEVKRIAFDNIDEHKLPPGDSFDYDRGAWADIVASRETQAVRESIDGEPVLTVFKPIENSEECQVCHGQPGEAGYDGNEVRAVLVVRRSQAAVEQRIEQNRRITLGVGAATSIVILGTLWLFASLFGVRLRRRRFA